MKHAIEAVLFAAGRYVEEEYISKVLQEDVRKVRKALAELREDYDKRDCAIRVSQDGKLWKLAVRDEYLSIASKLVSDKEIATTVLESLAVVAWKNPIQQAELIKIRGPAAYEHIAELVERGFLTKVPEGRSFKLTLQEKFFDYFDVEGREDLHKLFAPVGDLANAAQAEIDAKQNAYDEKVEAVQEALSSPNSSEPAPQVAQTPSAQLTEMAKTDFVQEIKEAAEQFANAELPEPPKPEKPETVLSTTTSRVSGSLKTEQAVTEVEKAVNSFGSELAQLKEEVLRDQEKDMGIHPKRPAHEKHKKNS